MRNDPDRHHQHPAFTAWMSLNDFVAEVLLTQGPTHEHDLDELQEPLAELLETIIFIDDDIGHDERRALTRTARRLLRRARASLPSLVTAHGMSAEQARTINERIDAVEDGLGFRLREVPDEPHARP
jgi:hypothetical protein